MRRFLAAASLAIAGVALVGSTTALARPSPAAASVSFVAIRGDIVANGDCYSSCTTYWNVPNGSKDALFDLQLPASTTKDVASVTVDVGNGYAIWDTIAGNGRWAIGVTAKRTSALLNNADSSYTADLTNGLRVYLHLDSGNGFYFDSGTTGTLTVTYSDATTTDLDFLVP
jgi:hypothetical protein